MLARDATPEDAARYEYEALEIRHCRLTVQMPLRMLPARPQRDMRFRCQRCQALLSANDVQAKWTRQADAHGVPKGRELPRFDG